MFGKQTSYTYLAFAFGLVLAASFFGNKFREHITDGETRDDYEMVKKYLLNDTALYGKNRPKLWIHSAYEINARKWKNFMSRNSTDLNQPYLYLTIQSIINHCGDNFHVCLIDDDSFEKLIPTWQVKMQTIPEPMRSRYRDLAMLQLLYIYGGMLVPNSFLCTKPLIELYTQGVAGGTAFIAEKIMYGGNKPFMPDVQFMGAPKECNAVQQMIEQCTQSLGVHFHVQKEFEGTLEKWCVEQIDQQRMQLLDGKIIGIKTQIGKPVLVEDLMSDDYLKVDDQLLHGIYIPKNELLRRPAFQWYSVLPCEDILEASNILSKYFKSSIVDGVDEYYKKRSTETSIIAI